MNLENMNLKNLSLCEKVVQVYGIETKNKNEVIKIAKELKKGSFAFKFYKNFIWVFCEYYSQVKKLMNILKEFECLNIEEKLAVMYEIKTRSKNHTKKLVKMLYQKGIFYKVPDPCFIWVFCGHYTQIEKLREILDKFDFISPIIKAE